jgi:hypothetical protein
MSGDGLFSWAKKGFNKIKKGVNKVRKKIKRTALGKVAVGGFDKMLDLAKRQAAAAATTAAGPLAGKATMYGLNKLTGSGLEGAAPLNGISGSGLEGEGFARDVFRKTINMDKIREKTKRDAKVRQHKAQVAATRRANELLNNAKRETRTRGKKSYAKIKNDTEKAYNKHADKSLNDILKRYV